MIKQLMLIVAAVLLLAHARPSEMPPTGELPHRRPPMCWTGWYNRDHASGKGDYETLKALREEYPGEICHRPVDIQAVTAHREIPAEKTDQKFYAYNTLTGFICRNQDQDSGRCRDYKVRFKCPCWL